LPFGKDWEAGENPALPRNCKRGHLQPPLGEIPGRLAAELGWKHPYSQSQETGAYRPYQPLSRAKEECMRIRAAVVVLTLVVAAAAAELKVKIVDPQSAAVAGAEVSLQRAGTQGPPKTLFSSAEGIVSFAEATPGNYQV
jgi:hypothetical protein